MTLPLVTEKCGPRPAGKPDECFYCNQKIGDEHKPDCVMLNRTVSVRYSFAIEINVPHGWTKEDIEFHRGESSWCASNAFDDIDEYLQKENHGCACGIFDCEVLDLPDMEPFTDETD